MNTLSQLPLLLFVFYLSTGAIAGASEDDRSGLGTAGLTAIADQSTKSKTAQIPKVSPTPLPNDWRGFVPLQSTRAEVERELGKAQKSRYSTHIYYTAHDRIDVLYSEGPCLASEVERWNVPKDVIIRIDVRPKHSINVKALVLDRDRYIRTRESHPNNWFAYSNYDDGIRVETIQSGRVEEVNSITYGPKSKDQSLRCSRE